MSASQVPYRVWDRSICQNSWPWSETHKVESASDGLCIRLVLEALVWVLGQLLRHQSHSDYLLMYNANQTTETLFFSGEGNKGIETCQNSFFFSHKNTVADQNSLTLVKPGSVEQTIQISFKKWHSLNSWSVHSMWIITKNRWQLRVWKGLWLLHKRVRANGMAHLAMYCLSYVMHDTVCPDVQAQHRSMVAHA